MTGISWLGDVAFVEYLSGMGYMWVKVEGGVERVGPRDWRVMGGEVRARLVNPSGSGIDIVDAPLSRALHGLWRATRTPWGRAEGCPINFHTKTTRPAP
eukprot:scaffold129801_cov81-Phaeocystis_antarctica.AAC.1